LFQADPAIPHFMLPHIVLVVNMFSRDPNSTSDGSGPYPVSSAGELFTLSLVPRAITSPDVDFP